MAGVQLISESYGSHERHTLDILLPGTGVRPGAPLIVFVHGGAWRVGDKSELTPLLTRLVEATGLAAASVNYRLSAHPDPSRSTQRAKHPEHVEDVADAILYLLMRRKERPWGDPNTVRLILGGHSCGAFICTSLLMDQRPYASLRTPEVALLRQRVVGLMASEPIIDVADMLDEYPSYAFFVDEAFPNGTGRAHNVDRLDTNGRPLKILITSTEEDELLSPRSAKQFTKRLHELSGLGEWTGESRFSGNGLDVELDLKSIHGKHDDVLQEAALPNLQIDWLIRKGFASVER